MEGPQKFTQPTGDWLASPRRQTNRRAPSRKVIWPGCSWWEDLLASDTAEADSNAATAFPDEPDLSGFATFSVLAKPHWMSNPCTSGTKIGGHDFPWGLWPASLMPAP